MKTEIYLVCQEKRTGVLVNSDFSFIHFQAAFNKKKDAELYLYQLKHELFKQGYNPDNDLDYAFSRVSTVPSFCFRLRDKIVKLTIKKIDLT